MSDAIKKINVHDLKNKIDANSRPCIIDVREDDEWQEFHIPGALHMPKNHIATLIASSVSDQTTPIYLYCRGGVRSLHAAQTLCDLGYTSLYSVDGGIMEWAAAGYPIIAPGA